jgi:hypothetical protein
MLEDMGMPIRYPRIQHENPSDNGITDINMGFIGRMGNRVSIEDNLKMKFIILFSILDLYIDTKNPELEGCSFSKKYTNLPSEIDEEIILRELFRFSKILRNALIHSPSSFEIKDDRIKVNYTFHKREFRTIIKLDSLNYFYLALIIFTKGDLGSGNYFIGMMRSIYSIFLDGIIDFSDEFEGSLKKPSDGLKIGLSHRVITTNFEHKSNNNVIEITYNNKVSHEYKNIDFIFDINEVIYLVPIEALDTDLKIKKIDLLKDWEYKGPFPPLK